jgi:diphthamide synthase (EF-2-diphthine--ammonia ligase)
MDDQSYQERPYETHFVPEVGTFETTRLPHHYFRKRIEKSGNTGQDKESVQQRFSIEQVYPDAQTKANDACRH